ncbi:MAG: hypothetical protein L0Y72_00180 [Gemmataceae bacterium]|nr:hypothetical protein [Gemmataceae bacterium]MCI0737426.1 hypothetical protein [Gemmataceae bacterium]
MTNTRSMMVVVVFFAFLLGEGKGQTEGPKKSEPEYEFRLDVKRILVLFSKDYFEVGRLNADGRFIPQGPRRPNGFNSPLEDFEEVINSPRFSSEPVYEFRSAHLIKGVLMEDCVFVPELGSKVIDLESYLKDYDPKKSPRIYNLPGRIVKKGEPEQAKKKK